MSTRPHFCSSWRLAASCLLALCLAACGAGDAAVPAAPKQASAERVATQPVNPRGAEAGPRPAHSPRAHRLTLSPVSEQATPRRTRTGPAPQRIGTGRSVPETTSAAATRALLQWQTMPGGERAAALSVGSPQAAGIRLGMLVHALPAAATVRVYAQDGSTAYQIAAADILDALRANARAGDQTDAGRTWWAPTVPGQEATLEIALPAHADPSQVDIALPMLSHLDVLPSQDVVTPKIGEAGFCQVDVSCSAEYDVESAAVLRVSFVEDGFSYLCSGTLMADRAATRTPYVLTADHCISTQSAASSVETDWFYRARTCGAFAVDGRSRTLSGGAALLYADRATDTSFLRLAAQAPDGASFAGWSTATPTLGAAAAAVHHPEGDLQKLSTGSLLAFQSCTINGRGQLLCQESDAANGNFLNARFGQGTTETGSSGSALFLSLNGRRYVVGQLYGGSASCFERDGTNLYGRFDIAYRAGLQQWLDNAPNKPVYRFFNRDSGAHFYTIDAGERDFVIATYPVYTYEGAAFDTYRDPQDGTTAVYRFYNASRQAHFYTASAGERDFVIATYPEYRYEGPAWYARETPTTGTTPLYRFFNRATGAHFYTTSADERAFVNRTYPSFVDEGIGYHVLPAR